MMKQLPIMVKVGCLHYVRNPGWAFLCESTCFGCSLSTLRLLLFVVFSVTMTVTIAVHSIPTYFHKYETPNLSYIASSHKPGGNYPCLMLNPLKPSFPGDLLGL